ncbi:hypothetical protein AB0I02_33315 [Streptomyces phaeochromogenes]
MRLVSEAGAPCVVRHGIAGAIEVRDPVEPNEEAPRWGLPAASAA